MSANALTSEIAPVLRRQIIALAVDHQPRTLLYELFDAFAEKALAELNQGSGRHTPAIEDVQSAIRDMQPAKVQKVFHAFLNAQLEEHTEALTVAFICGMLAANPGALLLGRGDAMLQNLGAPIGGKG